MSTDEFLTVSGIVRAVRGSRKRDGSRYKITSIETADGHSIDCAWWDPSLAPPIGARVAVSGKRMNNGLVSVQTSQIKPASGSPLSFEHRLLGFYRDCIEAETAQDRDLTPTSAAVHLVASEASMLLTGRHTFDGDPTTRGPTPAARLAMPSRSMSGSRSSPRIRKAIRESPRTSWPK